MRQDLRRALRDYNINVVFPRYQNQQHLSALQYKLMIFREYFEPLGDVRVGPSGIAIAINSNHVVDARMAEPIPNGDMVAAIKHSKVMRYEIEKRDDFYRLLRDRNYLQYPYLSQSNIDALFFEAKVDQKDGLIATRLERLVICQTWL